MSADIEHRLAELESLVQHQQDTIEAQRERNADLEDRLAAVEAQLGLEDTTADQTVADD
jgi:uncharacterized coiled-coil protein SlyX